MRGQLCPSSLLSWSPLPACGAQPCGHRSSPRPPSPFSLSSPNGGSRLSASGGAAAAASLAGAAAALEPPGALAPGWDPGTAPARGGHPGFWCDAACQGLGGGRQPTWAVCLRAVAVLWSRLSCAMGSTWPRGAGLGCSHNPLPKANQEPVPLGETQSPGAGGVFPTWGQAVAVPACPSWGRVASDLAMFGSFESIRGANLNSKGLIFPNHSQCPCQQHPDKGCLVQGPHT